MAKALKTVVADFLASRDAAKENAMLALAKAVGSSQPAAKVDALLEKEFADLSAAQRGSIRRALVWADQMPAIFDKAGEVHKAGNLKGGASSLVPAITKAMEAGATLEAAAETVATAKGVRSALQERNENTISTLKSAIKAMESLREEGASDDVADLRAAFIGDAKKRLAAIEKVLAGDDNEEGGDNE